MERGTSHRAAERADRRARESNTGLLMFMVMGRFMVELASYNEPDPAIRRAKRLQLMREWSVYTGHVAARAA